MGPSGARGRSSRGGRPLSKAEASTMPAPARTCKWQWASNSWRPCILASSSEIECDERRRKPQIPSSSAPRPGSRQLAGPLPPGKSSDAESGAPANCARFHHARPAPGARLLARIRPWSHTYLQWRTVVTGLAGCPSSRIGLGCRADACSINRAPTGVSRRSGRHGSLGMRPHALRTVTARSPCAARRSSKPSRRDSSSSSSRNSAAQVTRASQPACLPAEHLAAHAAAAAFALPPQPT